jgi:hypothetical protein
MRSGESDQARFNPTADVRIALLVGPVADVYPAWAMSAPRKFGFIFDPLAFEHPIDVGADHFKSVFPHHLDDRTADDLGERNAGQIRICAVRPGIAQVAATVGPA